MRNKSKNIIIPILASPLMFYVGNRILETYMAAPGMMIEKIIFCFDNIFSTIIATPFHIDLQPASLLSGFIFEVLLWLIYLYILCMPSNFRFREEHGSARWANPKEIIPFINKDFSKNILFSVTERLSMSFYSKKPEYNRNKNVIVVGGSGSGKTRGFLKPNLLQMNSSYIVTDPKGSALVEIGKPLHDNGYALRYFNTMDFSRSMHYNPFAYIKKEEDILTLVDVLILNTKGEGDKTAEDFWVKAERLLYQALIGYIWYEATPQDNNFTTLLYLLNNMAASEDDETFLSPIDTLFADLEEKNEDHFAVRQYKKYKQAAGKTAKSILISCGARLSPFDLAGLREITSYDELELDELGDDSKTALFLITDDISPTFNFIVGILFSQLFSVMISKAKTLPKERLLFPVQIYADEIMNICQIPNLQRIISVIRSYNVSMCPIVQNVAQIKAIYKDDAATIIGNCDTLLFLGSSEEETIKKMSERVGKETVNHRQAQESHGQNGSSSLSQQIIARDLITPDEVSTMSNTECLVFIRGLRPFKSKKYDLTKHPQYKYTADADSKNSYLYYQKKTAEDFLSTVTQVQNIDLSELNSLVIENEV